MVIPYVSILFLKFLEEKAGFDATSHPGLTPFTYLRASATSYPTNGYVVLAEAIILLALSIVVFFVGAKKDIL